MAATHPAPAAPIPATSKRVGREEFLGAGAVSNSRVVSSRSHVITAEDRLLQRIEVTPRKRRFGVMAVRSGGWVHRSQGAAENEAERLRGQLHVQEWFGDV